ncbi:MAG: phage integrase SAM-like domain-containing protein, partial [Chryseobacterium sp.]|nr:phage integrase SAM-like domain-containing protein [Chryseobacterium sp.]
MKIKIHLNTNQTKKQGHPLVISIYNGLSDRAYPFTGFYSSRENWDFEKEEPKFSHPNYSQIVHFILENRLKIYKMLSSGRKMSALQVQSMLFGNSESLYYFWQQRIVEMEESGKKSNANFYKTYLGVMKSYKSDILFEEINYAFLVKFKNHKLMTCNANGANVYLRTIRAIYNEAVKRGIYSPDSFVSPFNGIMEKATATK